MKTIKNKVLSYPTTGILIGSIMIAAACNNSNTASTNTTPMISANNNSDTTNDAQFLRKAAEINLEEIQVGRLAQQNGTMTDVRELGRMLADDHTKSWNELVILARNKSIAIPTALDDNAQADYKKLSEKSGNDFDKEFCTMMVSGHKDAIALFQKESKQANDTAIRQWAVATLPILQKHLDDATTCKEKCEKKAQ